MNEEENLTPGPEEEQGEEQPSTPSPRGRSVFPYLAVLFATAFLLLLFAYLMQQRDSEEIRGNLSDLRESMGSIQSIDQLVAENQALRQEINGLKEQAAAMEEELEQEKKITHDQEVQRDALNSALNNVQHVLGNTRTAMMFFWQINEAYVLEDYDLCQDLIERMENTFGENPTVYLADGEEGVVEDRPMAERYEEIVEVVKEKVKQ